MSTQPEPPTTDSAPHRGLPGRPGWREVAQRKAQEKYPELAAEVAPKHGQPWSESDIEAAEQLVVNDGRPLAEAALLLGRTDQSVYTALYTLGYRGLSFSPWPLGVLWKDGLDKIDPHARPWKTNIDLLRQHMLQPDNPTRRAELVIPVDPRSKPKPKPKRRLRIEDKIDRTAELLEAGARIVGGRGLIDLPPLSPYKTDVKVSSGPPIEDGTTLAEARTLAEAARSEKSDKLPDPLKVRHFYDLLTKVEGQLAHQSRAIRAMQKLLDDAAEARDNTPPKSPPGMLRRLFGRGSRG